MPVATPPLRIVFLSLVYLFLFGFVFAPMLLAFYVSTTRWDALSPLGIRHLDMPYTPQKVWRAIQGAKGGQA